MPEQGGAGAAAQDGVVLDLALEAMAFGDQVVLGALDLKVHATETVVLTGPSGIGKSTLLRIIAGLEDRHDGRVEISGRTAMVFQEPVLLEWRRALDNLTIACRISTEAAMAALEEVGLGGLADRFPAQMSLGQQRRLALARAFAVEPDLLMMDEPFVSLDAELRTEMMGLFAALRARRDTATLLVTHDVLEAEALGSRIVTLGGAPARIQSQRQNSGAYFQSSASGVTTFQS